MLLNAKSQANGIEPGFVKGFAAICTPLPFVTINLRVVSWITSQYEQLRQNLVVVIAHAVRYMAFSSEDCDV